MSKFLFDTNMVSYFMKGKYKELNKKIYALPAENRFINWVVQEELLYGIYRRERLDLEIKYNEFLKKCNIINSDSKITEICAKLESYLDQKGNSIELEDIWIAATCIALDLVLVTNNEKHFKTIPGLKVENWIN